MRFRPRHAREEPEINLIPLIDVLLVILIFLMITTTYSRYTELKVNLPTADAAKATERPGQIVVSITANGVYSVDKQVLDTRDVTSLSDALRSAAGSGGGPEPVVVINADAQAAHQAVVNVMEAARVAGLSHLTFATQTGNAAR
ncbi:MULTISPECIES: biopolymer transporter ExbD [Ralstonia solanacearum species complex]|uniref:Biopolymer transporter ExbD n=4 Tax=Ralstonia solanacearum species complex TaxID=3116862 RepID=A0A0K1ZIQ7_RALSL|nr:MULTISPECIES: biopolymer transporter ExbD [Ralstonia]AKZ25672.1 biopolymer transporter ExbD [Ralstonia solanacearum]APC69352.1 biopolymer transporter ExbD [Ralstonia solanacearum OE1-1]APF86154.1 biopolymer transporter ExbD [Ralstonia solanacearum FJAT-1458]ARS56931.1 biopolymer transporter ExbD [Ralstonia solanacearum FJAT-91]ESS47256.1 biopolymer transport EXBD-like transmembrane protein [Ralstonia solanacearum SD54]